MAVHLAFILLAAPATPIDAGMVAQHHQALWPEEPVPTVEAKDGILVLHHGDPVMAMVTPMPAPVPWSDLEGPCATSLCWPDATAAVKGHQAHLLVAVVGADGPVQALHLLSQFTAAVMAAVDTAIGMYWPSSGSVIRRDIFLDLMRKVLPTGPTMPVWVDVRVIKNPDGTCSAFTTGMASLGLLEIETDNASEQPGEVRERVWWLAGYLLEHGQVITDGHTIGNSASEKITVRHGRSAHGIPGTVMQLHYPGRRAWWRFW